MRLPQLTELATAKDVTEEFKGYNHNLRQGVGEWYDMKNMTTDDYPVASVRKKRSTQYEMDPYQLVGEVLQGCYGVTYGENENEYESVLLLRGVMDDDELKGLCIVEADGVDVAGADYSTLDVNDKTRQLIRFGADTVVMPDGAVYNQLTGEVKKIAKQVTLPSYTTFATCVNSSNDDTEYTNIPGEKYNETNGYRFRDNQVQQLIENEDGTSLWVAADTYVMIYSNHTTDDIFDGIEAGDSVTFVPAGSVRRAKGIVAYDEDNGKWVETNFKILKKGTKVISGATRYYVIVKGFVSYHATITETIGDVTTTETADWSTLKFYTQTTLKRKFPDVAFACESQNRIWCCSKDGHEIYASALGNPYNYYDYSGLATDSYAVNVGTYGQFTGCCNYLGRPLFFKENALHAISGSYPTNLGALDGMSYAVTTTTEFKGVERGSERSLAIIDNVLYYKSSAGIVAYDGSNTVVISDALGNEKYKNAVAGAYGTKYYVSMEDSNGEYHMFVYDTKMGTWCKEDNVKADFFINVYNDLLYISNEKIHSVTTEKVINVLDPEKDAYAVEDDVPWMCETGNMGYSYPNNKYVSRIQVRMQMDAGAKAAIYVQYDSDGVWIKKGDMQSKGIRTFLIPIVPRRCDHMKIKFEGTGDVKIYSIAKMLEEGGDKV